MMQADDRHVTALIVVDPYNTCIEATVRYAAELGYEVSLIKDATAAFTWEQLAAAIEINLPNYAESIITTDELLHRLPAGTPA